MDMNRSLLGLGALLAAIAVLLGAFGAHGLNGKIPAESLVSFKTGVTYQFYHALALLFCSLLEDKLPAKALRRMGWLFGIGILCFSGSIYLLSTRELTGWNLSFVGPITPIGGLLFISGWISLLFSAFRRN
ncbi:MAG: DUF423 domain-containing protein [Saprospiraceae bacterium]|nr:DUF423 domain-containing protein [Saprospiraceae bacterium]